MLSTTAGQALGFLAAACLLGFAAAGAAKGADMINLAGEWRFQADHDDKGVEERWFDAALAGTIRLPGAMRDAGLGDPVGPGTIWNASGGNLDQPRYAPYRTADNFKMPFWLQPTLRYWGAAWYQKTVDVPADWAGKHVTLFLERPHWQTTVWVNDAPVGSAESFAVPGVFDLSDALRPGENRITLRIDNRLVVDVGDSAHSNTDHTQTPWHGVVGQIELRARPAVWVDDVQVHGDLAANRVRVVAALGNRTKDAALRTARVTVLDPDGETVGETTADANVPAGGGGQTFEVALTGTPRPWDEFRPDLYTLKVGLGDDETQTRFGLRTIETRGSEFYLNGRRVYFRGALDCAIFPKTGYPPTDVESWRKIIRTMRAYGLNHTRFHSWCPPEAAFVAADELGHYLQVEASAWPNSSTSKLGEGMAIDQWLYEEGERLVRAYANHPSFLLLSACNEPGGPERGGVYLKDWVAHFKGLDDRHLVTSGSGWPELAVNDFHVTPTPRLQLWGAGLNGALNKEPPATTADYSGFVAKHSGTPVISHEIGQWCVYPDFDEAAKYTGSLKPKNYEIFRDFLEQKHMLDQARDFLMASGRLQVLAYKEEIERALRTPGFGGFQLLGLQDFPGQGTAPVGVLDAFWEDKPYTNAAEYSRFCNDTVLLARLTARTFVAGEAMKVGIDVAHFGRDDLKDAKVRCELRAEDGRVLAGSTLDVASIPAGGLTHLGDAAIDAPSLPAAAKVKLVLEVIGTDLANDWDLWIYPPKVDTAVPAGVTVTRDAKEAAGLLEAGKRVLLLADPAAVATGVELGFSPIFWNTAYTGGQAPQTLGVLVDPKHPSLGMFPTDYHSDWQWWDLVMHAATVEMDALPAGLRPIVQVVPDWHDPKRLGLAFEAKVGTGRLLLCSMDLTSDLERRPVARQMLASLLAYAGGEAFDPQIELTAGQVDGLFREPPRVALPNATATASTAHPNHPAANVLDGDPKTIWHTPWTPATRFPHDLTVDLGTPHKFRGVRVLPRQEQQNGRIARYEIAVSDDGQTWGEPAANGTWANTAQPQQALFDGPRTARYVRLRALSEVGGNDLSSLAEFDVIPADDE